MQVILFLPLLSAGCDAPSLYDRGGVSSDYINEMAGSFGRQIRPIERECDSACVVKLAGNYCVQRDGSFGVHASKYTATGQKVPLHADQVRAAVPSCFRNLADSKGAWQSFRITRIPAREVLRACPRLKVCG